MTARDFCYWLNGYFELQDAGNPTNVKIDKGLISEKVECIKKHLSLVFAHDIDPKMGNAETLNAIHNPNGEARPRC